MKSKFIVASTLVLLCCTQPSLCQITSYVPAEEKKQTEEILPIPYDSLTIMSKYVLQDDQRRGKGYIGEVMYYDKPTTFLVDRIIENSITDLPNLGLSVYNKSDYKNIDLAELLPATIVYTNIYRCDYTSKPKSPKGDTPLISDSSTINQYYTIIDVIYPKTEEYTRFKQSFKYDQKSVVRYDILKGTSRMEIYGSNPSSYKLASTGDGISYGNPIKKLSEKPFIVDRINNSYHKFLLKLVNNATQDTVYTETIGTSLAYFEKIKSLHLNKEFLVRSGKNTLNDYVTSKNITVQPMQEFTCSEISLYNGAIIAVLESQDVKITQTIGKEQYPAYCDYDDRIKSSTKMEMEKIAKTMSADDVPQEPRILAGIDLLKGFIPKEYYDNYKNYVAQTEAIVAAEQKKEQAQKDAEWKALEAKVAQDALDRKNSYIAKYGEQFGTAVAGRKVMIGMNEQMVRDAWGNPFKIQQTNTVQTFIYYNSLIATYKYVKIKGDKVIEVYQ